MIKIVKTNNSITITGHANYAEYGKDIVCASISALFQVFIESVNKYTSDIIKADISAGNACVEWLYISDKGKLLLDSFSLGCHMAAETYPGNVKIIEEMHS